MSELMMYKGYSPKDGHWYTWTSDSPAFINYIKRAAKVEGITKFQKVIGG